MLLIFFRVSAKHKQLGGFSPECFQPFVTFFLGGRNRSETKKKSCIQSGKSLICSDSAKVSPSNARRALLADDKTFRWALCSLPSRSLASWLFKMTSQKVPSIQKFRSSFQGPQVLVEKSEKMSRRQKVLLFSGQPNGGKEGTKSSYAQ